MPKVFGVEILVPQKVLVQDQQCFVRLANGGFPKEENVRVIAPQNAGGTFFAEHGIGPFDVVYFRNVGTKFDAIELPVGGRSVDDVQGFARAILETHRDHHPSGKKGRK